MFTKQILIDSTLAVGLLSALAIVFAVDRRTPPPPPIELAEGEEEPVAPKSLLGANRPTVRRTPAPRPDSIYAERVSENRVEVVQKRGGSQISEQAVKDGLDWLSRHQAQDGSWSNRCIGNGPAARCEKQGPCNGPGTEHTIAHTGLALLAFQGGGHFWFNESPYSSQVKRGLDWLISKQRQDGCLAVGSGRLENYFMYEHAIASFALAEACALAKHSDQQPDRKHQEALEKAIKFIEECQDPYGGGWRYHPKEAGDSSVSGWVVLALKSASAADVKLDPTVVPKCLRFFEHLEMKSDGRTGYNGKGSQITEATTGVGMLVHHFLMEKSDTPLVKAASNYLARYAERTWGGYSVKNSDYYTWYNCTLGMYLAGGENWDKWNGIVRKQLEQLQEKSGCQRGSWPANDQWSKNGGRIYSTSLAILTLEVYYRFAKKNQQTEQPMVAPQH